MLGLRVPPGVSVLRWVSSPVTGRPRPWRVLHTTPTKTMFEDVDGPPCDCPCPGSSRMEGRGRDVLGRSRDDHTVSRSVVSPSHEHLRVGGGRSTSTLCSHITSVCTIFHGCKNTMLTWKSNPITRTKDTGVPYPRTNWSQRFYLSFMTFFTRQL